MVEEGPYGSNVPGSWMQGKDVPLSDNGWITIIITALMLKLPNCLFCEK